MARFRLTPGGVTSRYLIREFLALLLPILAAFLILYLIVDFFGRLDTLLKNHAALSAALRYFLFKIPLVLTQILPAAVLAAMLLSLGMLSRHNEIVALRSTGVSLLQTALPLLGVALLLSVVALLWNETVVPYCTRQYQYVNAVEIRNRPQHGILNEREIWYHGADGFYNIDHVDAGRGTLFGLTLYRVDAAFNLWSIIEARSMRWTGTGWSSVGAVERTFAADGAIHTRALAPDEQVLHEPLADFLEVRREPEELSYLDLRQRIHELGRKGIDASSYLVDLHLKLAVPFTTFVLACVAVPLAGRAQRNPSLAATVGTGLATGFAYWVVLALGNSLGQSDALPAIVSAWIANTIFMLIGAALFLNYE